MPAVMLQNRITHRHQNCGVRIALFALTFAPTMATFAGFTFNFGAPDGVQSGCGSRMQYAPMAITAAYTTASVINVGSSPAARSASSAPPPNASINRFEAGEAMSAPPPKPMMASPVDRPGRSGNHFISVDTGEM